MLYFIMTCIPVKRVSNNPPDLLLSVFKGRDKLLQYYTKNNLCK